MARIYLPVEVNQNQCAVVVSDGHIRIYSSRPNGQQQNNVTYTDFYIRENYLQTNGSTNWNQYTTQNCVDHTQFSTDYWDRPDIWQSLICFAIIGYVGIVLPFKIISRLFGRWLKYD